MTEFDGRTAPKLSIGLPLADFEQALFEVGSQLSDEVAYGMYQECLGTVVHRNDDAMRIKEGLLHQASGDVEHRQGEHDKALASYARARGELAGYDNLRSFILEVNEGHMLMYDLRHPAGAIPRYQAARSLFEHYYSVSEKVPPPNGFEGYTGVLSHLAMAYGMEGQTEELREISKRIADCGGLTPALFGFGGSDKYFDLSMIPGRSEEEKTVCQAVKKWLAEAEAPEDRDQLLAELRNFEGQVDQETFLADMPEQRAFILQALYSRFAILVVNPQEQEAYINRALGIVKQHNFLAAKVDLYLMLGGWQASQQEPPAKLIQASRRAFAAMEECLDAALDAETAQTLKTAAILIAQLANRKDMVGIERVHRRLAERGINLKSTSPGAQNPHLN